MWLVDFNQIAIRITEIGCVDTPISAVGRLCKQLDTLFMKNDAGGIDIFNTKHQALLILCRC